MLSGAVSPLNPVLPGVAVNATLLWQIQGSTAFVSFLPLL